MHIAHGLWRQNALLFPQKLKCNKQTTPLQPKQNDIFVQYSAPKDIIECERRIVHAHEK